MNRSYFLVEHQMLYLIPIVCFCLFVIVVFIIYCQPRAAIFLLSKIHSDVLFFVDLPSNLLYISLTIDDFPNPHDLSISFKILDLLRLYNARCTFFLIGSYVEKYGNSLEIQTLFERLKADGHEIGNHGWRDERALNLSENELRRQITETENIIRNHTDTFEKKWFRPGSGFFNRRMIQICANLGYRLVLGSIYPYDPQITNPTLNSYFIEYKLHPGAIVILHDRLITIETLQKVLPAVQRKRFEIVTVTELIELKR